MPQEIKWSEAVHKLEEIGVTSSVQIEAILANRQYHPERTDIVHELARQAWPSKFSSAPANPA
jgi:hypothetical protein